MNQILEQALKENNTKDNEQSLKELMIIETVKRINNPFKSLTVKDVAKDLNVGINSAYDLFKREDFPAIEVGNKRFVSLLAYLVWKSERHL